MRSLKITVALAAIACVVGALASPALAKNAKPKEFFGEFVASRAQGGPITPSSPATAKSKEGELDEFVVGNENKPLFAFACNSISSVAKVFSERSTTFKTEVKFHKCEAERHLTQSIKEGNLKTHEGLKTKIGPGLEFEFHSNGSFVVGKEENNELKITKGTSVGIAVKGGLCKIVIPEQTVPKNGTNEEKEYEGGEYSGEREPVTNLKTYPDGFKEQIEVDWTLSKILIEIPVSSSGPCQYEREPGGKFNEETHSVQIPGLMEGELDEINIKKGELFFETRKEHEEKEI